MNGPVPDYLGNNDRTRESAVKVSDLKAYTQNSSS